MQKMRLNLQFFASGTIDGSSTASNCDCRITWSSTKNDDNTSKVTASVQVKKSGSSSTSGTFSGTLKIDGTSYSISKYDSWSWGSWHTVGTKTKTITHNEDGTKSISISANLTQTGTSMAGTYKASGTAKLDTINRASKINEIDDFSIDDTITISITKYVSTFTDNLVISVGGTTIKIINSIVNGYSLTFSETEKNTIKSLMTSPKINLLFTLTSLNGTTEIGSSSVVAEVSSLDKPVIWHYSKKDNGHYQMAINGVVDETNESPLQIYDDEGNLISLGGGGEGGTTDYSELTNKPSINGVTLSGSKSLNDLGIQPKGNYLTSVPDEYITESELNAKGYITGYEESDPIFSASPSASITNEDIENWDNKSEFSGNYNDLTNKPTIPSNYVTTDTTQDVTGSKNFKNVMKIQNGQGTGSLWIGGDVNANTLTNNKRRLARVVVPTFSDITKGATLLGFDSSGDSDLHVTNKGSDVVSFGGMKKITNATSPMGMAFCVANTRGGMASTDKVYPLEMDANEVRFNVQPNYNGIDLATIDDIPTKTSDLTNDSGYLTEHQDISGKQDVLVSGTNIKTINNQSLLGSGNITISSGSGGTSDYNSLENIPQINSVSLVGNKTLDDLGIQAKGNYALSNDIPTKTSELTNDSGFITSIPTRNIVTANVGDSSIAASGSVTFALSKRVQIGTGLTINNNCITIGAGISVVLASANIRFENGGSSQNFNFYLIHRKPDDTYTIYGNARRQGVPANTTASASISSQLIEVEEGDTIEIALWKGSSTATTVVANVTNLTVEAV